MSIDLRLYENDGKNGIWAVGSIIINNPTYPSFERSGNEG
ncbi:hypothetical protein NC99_04370 [Sunxiuqinia dokdonensis]|uniref:Uncharacterized protein n=1 Tax=Sunxiuqinia dokdonensis TaxID=1409788 RepID=A0A0L8VE47_9BACT|nr:hypothetical protein NC99_04370 [Sunxiuqinia dokdonensis]